MSSGEMPSFKQEFHSSGEVTALAQQTPARNISNLETKFVDTSVNPVQTPDMGLPPVDKKAVGETAAESRVVLEKLREASTAQFNAEKEKNDVRAVEGADSGVVNGALKIIDFMSMSLAKKADRLEDRSKKRGDLAKTLEENLAARRYNKDYTGSY